MKATTYATLDKVFRAFPAVNTRALTLPQVMTMLAIINAGDNGVTVSELAHNLGLTTSAASRNWRALLSSEEGGEHTGGGLVFQSRDLQDSRVYKIFAKPELMQVGKKLDKILAA